MYAKWTDCKMYPGKVTAVNPDGKSYLFFILLVFRVLFFINDSIIHAIQFLFCIIQVVRFLIFVSPLKYHIWKKYCLIVLKKGHTCICFWNISFCVLLDVIFLFYSGSFDILFYDGFKKTVQGINIKMMPKDVQQQVSNLHNSVSHDE